MSYIDYVLNKLVEVRKENTERVWGPGRPNIFDRPKLRIVIKNEDDRFEEGRQRYFDYWQP
jgi:hypothetical protein